MSTKKKKKQNSKKKNKKKVYERERNKRGIEKTKILLVQNFLEYLECFKVEKKSPIMTTNLI